MTDLYEKIRLVTQQFGTWEPEGEEFGKLKVSFERDGLKIEGSGVYDLEEIISDRFNIIYKGENVYSNIIQQKDSTAAIYKPGEWERKLDELYVEAKEDREERIKKKLASFKDIFEFYKEHLKNQEED